MSGAIEVLHKSGGLHSRFTNFVALFRTRDNVDICRSPRKPFFDGQRNLNKRLGVVGFTTTVTRREKYRFGQVRHVIFHCLQKQVVSYFVYHCMEHYNYYPKELRLCAEFHFWYFVVFFVK